MNIHKKPLPAQLHALVYTESAINSTVIWSTGYLSFFLLYLLEVPLTFDYTLANPSNGILKPATISSLINTMQNATTESNTTNTPKLGQNNPELYSKCKITNIKSKVIAKAIL